MNYVAALVIFFGLLTVSNSIDALTKSVNSMQSNKTIFIDAIATCSPMPECEKWLQELNKP